MIRILLSAVTTLVLVNGAFAQTPSKDEQVRQTVQSFYAAFMAVVTVTSRMSTFTTPDRVRHENERHIRTFVVVKRSDRWLIMQDQNTVIER